MFWKGITMKKIKIESYLLMAFLLVPDLTLAQKNDDIVVTQRKVDLTEINTLDSVVSGLQQKKVVTSRDFDFFFTDPFICGKDDKYGDLTAILSTGECFNFKRSRTEGKNEGFLISEEALLEADEQICNCLKADKNPKIAEKMNLSHREQYFAGNQQVSDSINKNLGNLVGTIESLRDSMLFQADLLFRDSRGNDSSENNQDTNKLVTFYSGGFVTSSFNEGPGRQRFTEMRGTLVDASKLKLGREIYLTDNFSSRGTDKKEANADLEKKIDQALNETKISPPNIELISQPDFEEGQCIGPKEFIAKNQHPSENEFYLELAEEKFDEKNWNYNLLEEQLIELSKDEKKNINRITQLEMRMKYLNRNPFIKNFFATNDDPSVYLKDFAAGSIGARNKIRSTDKKFIKDKKQDLFNIIKTQLGPTDKSCGQRPSGCKNEAIKNYSKFKAMSDEFFKDEKVGLFTNAQAQRSMFSEIEKFKSDPLSVADDLIPYNQEAIEKFVLSKTYYDPGKCHNRAPAGSGEGYSFDLVSCIDAYGLYCSTLAMAKENDKKGIIDIRARTKQLAKDTKSFFNPDINENHELKKFNEEFCNSSRAAKDGSGNKSFNEFKQSYCGKNRGNPECGKSTFENIAKLRDIYRKNYTFPRDGNESKRALIAAQESFDSWNMGIKDTPLQAANAAAGGGRAADFPSSLEQFLNDFSAPDYEVAVNEKKFEEAGMFTNLANVVSESKIRPSTSSFESSYDEITSYSNLGSFSQTASESAKIDELSNTQKEEILGQWRDELAELRRENKESSTASVDSSSETQLKAKIEALETLLSQQQKLTADQYKLLNSAITNRQVVEAAKTSTSPNSQNNTDKESMEKARIRSSSGFTTTALASGNLTDDSMRGPASVKDGQSSLSGGGAGASVQRSSSSSGARSSADSVAREEAKLVNLRRFPDGSITIESPTKGGQIAPNAITVPVSDEQYRLLQSNPGALSLSQIEKSIPKEQLAVLEKSGQIILVLQNGENPPFEVKVEKKDNQLVYQLQDPHGNKVNPVQRIFTRKALELELKVQ